MLVDGRGVPLSLVVTGANRHDVTQLELVLEEIIIERPEDIEQHLCADKAMNTTAPAFHYCFQWIHPPRKNAGRRNPGEEKQPRLESQAMGG